MLYEVTITLDPSTYKLSIADQIKLSKPLLLNVLMKGFQCSGVIELTASCNVHYHLLIEFKDFKAKNLFCRRYYVNRGHTLGKIPHISQVTHYQNYIDYMKKSLQENRVNGFDPIICDYHCVLGDIKYQGFEYE